MKKFLLLSAFCLVLFYAPGQNSNQPFRIVGYYSMRSAMTDSRRPPFKYLTHINLYFLNPDSLGNFTRDFSALGPFVSKAHQKNVKVMFSIGGGSEHPYYHRLLQDENRANFVTALVGQVMQYNIDGIDVDLEGNDIDNNYEAFVSELAAALKAKEKLITSAIAVYYKDQLSDRAIENYDFVNIMCYDRTGPWRPDKPGPHSTYADAEDDLTYFGTDRNIAKDKMTLGVPFYGYGFGADPSARVATMSYSQIVKEFHGSQTADEWKMPDGKIMYYNGIPTIKQKTALAMQKASGIMIWQIGGDAKGSKSLLKTIYLTSR
jgi:chitinase